MDDGDLGGGELDAAAGGGDTIVDRWLQPLDGEPCGEDLEYDNEFLELTQAAAGRPESQFAPAEPPDWRLAKDKAESLFERTRDLRIALLWSRAKAVGEGWGSLPESLRLVHGLLDRYWDELHPRPDPDDGDAYARINALEAVDTSDNLLGDLRQAAILSSRGHGELRGRDIEIALEHLAARDDESPPSRSQIEQILREAVDDDPALQNLATASIARLEAMTELMRQRVGYERAPAFDALLSALNDLRQLMPADDGQAVDSDASAADNLESRPRASRGGLGDGIESREAALRAIDMVCDFLERTEPTSPAQLLLRRAQRLVNKNFLELVHELAPEALAEVARVMGVRPESIAGSGEVDSS